MSLMKVNTIITIGVAEYTKSIDPNSDATTEYEASEHKSANAKTADQTNFGYIREDGR